MAHAFESGFFVTTPAWHGLGTILQAAPTSADAIKAAGLQWGARKVPLSLPDGRKSGAFGIVRDSDGAILSPAVGPDYTILQNSEAFEWIDPLVSAGLVTLDAAGSLMGGGRVWILARINEADEAIRAGDHVKAFLLLSNDHTGRATVAAGRTIIRVVCANTEEAARAAGGLIKVRHTATVRDRLDAARDLIVENVAEFKATCEKYRALAAAPVRSTDEIDAYFLQVATGGKSGGLALASGADDKAPAARTVAAIRREFENPRGVAALPAKSTSFTSFWDLFNAVTQWTTHARGRTDDARVSSQWFGPSADTNARALEIALRFAR